MNDDLEADIARALGTVTDERLTEWRENLLDRIASDQFELSTVEEEFERRKARAAAQAG